MWVQYFGTATRYNKQNSVLLIYKHMATISSVTRQNVKCRQIIPQVCVTQWHGAWRTCLLSLGKKVFYGQDSMSFPVENLLPQNVGSIINYLQ